jgi:hypothetical protein
MSEYYIVNSAQLGKILSLLGPERAGEFEGKLPRIADYMVTTVEGVEEDVLVQLQFKLDDFEPGEDGKAARSQQLLQQWADDPAWIRSQAAQAIHDVSELACQRMAEVIVDRVTTLIEEALRDELLEVAR